MGDTATVRGQRRLADALVGDVTHGPARTLHRATSAGLYTWSSSARATASAARPATSGSPASRRSGRRGLRDRSRAPHHCPHRIAADVAGLICAARRQHPSWGPREAARLARAAPSASSDACPRSARPAICWRRRGLVKKRRRRRRHSIPASSRRLTTAPNDLWTADFKGHFRTRDGVYCYPLTVADQHTRYLLACHGLLSTKGHGVRPVFERALSRVRPAARDSHRQRRALRHDRHPRPLAAQRLVAAARHPASAHPARPARSRTAPTSGCTRPSRARRSVRRRSHLRTPAARLQRLPPRSTTTSGPTRRSTAARPPRSTGRRRAPTRHAAAGRVSRATSSSSASPTPAPSA